LQQPYNDVNHVLSVYFHLNSILRSASSSRAHSSQEDCYDLHALLRLQIREWIPPPPKKKFTNPIIREAGIVELSNAVDNTTEGSGVEGHVIRGTNTRSILTTSSTNTLPLISGYPDLFYCPPTTNPNDVFSFMAAYYA
jgi:hypothetical protein